MFNLPIKQLLWFLLPKKLVGEIQRIKGILTQFFLYSLADSEAKNTMEELVMAAQELPAITSTLRELAQFAQSNRVSCVALTETQIATVKATLKCVICRGVCYFFHLKGTVQFNEGHHSQIGQPLASFHLLSLADVPQV